MTSASDNGIVNLRSPYSAPETLQRLEAIVKEKGIHVFALIDHSGEAEKAGLTMQFTKLLIFGSPQSGTPLMVASPGLALDLPLKALVWKDVEGSVWLSYNSPEFLRERHGIPDDLVQNIAGIRSICEQAVHDPQ
jgi:uncharacterized protein (DUF302 family)